MPAATPEVRLICLAVADCFPVCFVFFSTMFGGSMIVTMVVLITWIDFDIKINTFPSLYKLK